MATTKKTQRIYENRRLKIQYKEAEIERIIASSFRSCMSDSKWKRLFDDATDEFISCCKWKFVEDDRSWITDLPKGSDIERGYYTNFYGYFRLKYLQWLDLITDEPESLRRSLLNFGQFELEIQENALRVYGYR